MHNSRNYRLLIYVLFFTALSANLNPIQAEEVSMKEKTTNMIAACASGNYITLDELYSSCAIPGSCNQQMECEEKFALVTGFISYINTWSKEEYPWLPHDKFLMYNSSGDINIEVRIAPEAAEKIFHLIQKHKNHPEDPVYITGQLAGVDLPIMESCHRDLVIDLLSSDAISFGNKANKGSNL